MDYKKEIIKILEDEAVLLDEGYGTTGITEDEHEKIAERIVKLFAIPVVMPSASRPDGICDDEWWCPNCKRVLDDKEVTFDERHDQENCYAKVL